MIPSAAINTLRRLTNRSLTQTCTIEREAQVQTAYGHEMQWAEVDTGVPCRLIRASRGTSGTMVNEGQEVMTELYRLILKHDNTDLTVNSRVTVDGRTYDVQDIRDDLTQNADVQATVKRVR
ncbi:MAG: phage head completion protein [Aggregatilineales bacterium]